MRWNMGAVCWKKTCSSSSESYVKLVHMMPTAHTSDTVVMLHGLARTPRSMLGAGLWFQRAGFEVAYVGYPSRQMGIAQAVHEHVAPQLAQIAARAGTGRVHFITHSLGGIVFRAWAAGYAETFPLGRAVLLAPPNQGSQIVDKLGGWDVAQKIMGPVLQELGTGEKSTHADSELSRQRPLSLWEIRPICHFSASG
jgi:triacylglycerol esterase/lipase EstA (alpha/beta hydrolase family)